MSPNHRRVNARGVLQELLSARPCQRKNELSSVVLKHHLVYLPSELTGRLEVCCLGGLQPAAAPKQTRSKLCRQELLPSAPPICCAPPSLSDGSLGRWPPQGCLCCRWPPHSPHPRASLASRAAFLWGSVPCRRISSRLFLLLAPLDPPQYLTGAPQK